MSWLSGWLLTLIVFLPLVGAIAVMLLPERAARLAAAIFTGGVFLISLWLYFGLLASGGTVSFGDVAHPLWYVNLPWINVRLGGFHFQVNYALGADGLSIPMIILNGLLSFLAVVGSCHIDRRIKFYLALLLLLEFGVMGVFAAFDLFLFFFFWEVELIPMFLLIGIWGGARREYAAWKFLIYTFVGSAFTLAGIFLLYIQTGQGNALYSHLAAPAISSKLTGGTLPFFGAAVSLPLVLFLLLFAAFAVKLPMWPVHTWLPDAHVEAPTAGSVILAGILLKMGGYGFLRFSVPMFPAASVQFTPLIFALSVIAIVYTSLVAFRQTDFKKLIAYSSVAHMGFVTMGIFSGTAQGEQGAIFQMLSHGVISGALFLCVGVVYDRMHTREIGFYGGLVNRMPWYAAVFMLFTMGNVGLPGTSGFVGEILSMTGAYSVSTWTVILAATGVILAPVYMLTVYRRVIFGEITNHALAVITDLDAREVLIFAPFIIATLLLGLQPDMVFNVTGAATDNLVAAFRAASGR